MIRTIGSCLAVSIAMNVLAAVSLGAQPPATAPATQPATQPTTRPADVSALIKQLGDDDFHVRLKAASDLKAMGKSILPALQEARKLPDPEVHARVEEVIASFEQPAVDDSPVPQRAPANGGFSHFSSSTSMGPGGRVIEVDEGGRTIHIDETPGKIHMKVVGVLDGKPASKEYNAKSAEQLKKEHPNAFVLYQQHAGHGIGFAGGNGQVQMKIQVQGNGAGNIVIGPGGAQAGMNVNDKIRDMAKLNHLQVRLTLAMRNQQIPEAQQQELLALVAKLRAAIPDAQKPEKEQEVQKHEFERLGDVVRSKIAELKLGDFDAHLPPKPEKAKE